MPDLPRNALCHTAVWLSLFVFALVISLVHFGYVNPALCTPECKKQDQETRDTILVSAEINSTNDPIIVEGEAFCGDDNNNEDCKDVLSRSKPIPCWYKGDDRTMFVIYSSQDGKRTTRKEQERILFHRFRVAGVILSILSSLFLLHICITRIFKSELMHCCPRFVLTAIINFNAMLTRNHSGHSSQSPGGHSHTAQSSRDSTAALRRRISILIEGTKLSEEQCKHATHSVCLQNWLEKGRAVCCLCGAGVFPDDTKQGISTSSFTSANDSGPSESLRVERTQGVPSSPATSISIEQSQSRHTTSMQSDRHGEQV